MNPLLIFVAFMEFIGAVILLTLLAGIRRGSQSASAWHRTTACIQTFGMTEGSPKASYEYQVEGVTYTASAITPGAFYFGKNGNVKTPKAVCLNPDGSLKFEPGASVEVFYHPRNPADAVLTPGVRAREVIPQAALGLAFVVLPLIAWQNQHWMAAHVRELVGAFFGLGGMAGLGATLYFLRQCWQTRNYPCVTGRLLNASIAYDSGSENGGYFPVVDYEYTVEGKCYQSQQLTAIPVRTLTSEAVAQAKVDRLLATPEPTVYYNPKAPWESFLRPGPYWGLAIPLAIGVGFAIFGVLYLRLT